MGVKPQFMIICGDGINCEKETKISFEEAGFRADLVHINELLERKEILLNYDGLCFPGGFSFGDELGSGQVLNIKLRVHLGEILQQFIQLKRPILGICNGFQVLVKLGLLNIKKKKLSLTNNRDGQFINQWVTLNVHSSSPCIWTKNLPDQIDLPVRHGEGRLLFDSDVDLDLELDLDRCLIPLTYTEDINGSTKNIAGLCDSSGLILGLMPHPEGFRRNLMHPILGQKKERMNKGVGQLLFENAFAYFQ